MLSKRKKIIYLSGTRADYSLMSSALLALNKICDLRLIVTGMHLKKEFGMTINEIKKDGLKILVAIKFPFKQKTNEDAIKNFGHLVSKLSEVIKPNAFDICIAEGDRFESLAMAIAAKQANIPVFHQGGGDKSGSIDDDIRWAVTSFADIHFPGNAESVERLKKFGVPSERIFMFGEPGLDDIAQKKFLPAERIYKKYGIDRNKPLILAIQHPDTKERISPQNQIKPLLKAMKKLKIPSVIIYPNNDPGSLEMIKEIKKCEHIPFIRIFKSLPRADFLGLLNVCSLMAGNSSAGLVDLSLLKTPFINIGNRQTGRLRDSNVIDVPLSEKRITAAIKNNLNKKGRFRIKYVYGRGKFVPRFINFIKSYARNRQLY